MYKTSKPHCTSITYRWLYRVGSFSLSDLDFRLSRVHLGFGFIPGIINFLLESIWPWIDSSLGCLVQNKALNTYKR